MKRMMAIVMGLVVMGVVSGCQAGWLDTGSSGMTIQVGTVDGSVTTRLDAIEMALETMPQRDLDVMGDGTTWTVAESNRNWTAAALSLSLIHIWTLPTNYSV